MFRYLSTAMRSFSDTGRLRDGPPRAGGLARPVDTYRRAHRMVPTCRPEKAARFVFRQLVADAAAPMRASPARLTFSGRHDQERRVASASRIRQGRSRVRARGGRLP